MLDDPLLDLLQPEVVLVEDAARLGQVERDGFGRFPGQLDEPLQIGAHHAVLGRGLGGAGETAQLLAGLLHHFVRHAGRLDRALQLHQLFAIIGLAKLPLDGGHLLAQQGLTLTLAERLAGPLGDLTGEAQDLQPLRQEGRDPVEPRLQVHGLQDLLLLRRLQVEIGGHEVGERSRGAGALDRAHQFGGRRLRQELQRFQGLAAQMQEPGLDLGPGRLRLGDPSAPGGDEGIALQPFGDLEPLDALAGDVGRPVRPGHIAKDVGERPHPVQRPRSWVGRLKVLLQDQHQRVLFAQGVLGGRHGARAIEHDREDDPGKDDVGHGHDDDRVLREVAHAAAGGIAAHRAWPVLCSVTVRQPCSACQSMRP